MTTVSTSKSGRTLNPILAPLLVGGAVLVALVLIVADGNPNDGPTICVFRRTTGWWCPGCGLTRATHYLFRGDIVQALNYHLLVIPVLALFAIAWWSWIGLVRGRRPLITRIFNPTVTWVSIAALVAFVVVRNLPGMEFLIGG